MVSEDTTDKIQNTVSEWIEKNGIGFELKVAGLIKSKFKNSNLKVELSHSRQYVDFDEELGRTKLREVDLVARISTQIRPNFAIHSWLIVECKNHTNPFVLYKNTEPNVLPGFQPLGDIWNVLNSGDFLFENILGATSSEFLNQSNRRWCYSINSKVEDKAKESRNRNIALDGFWQVNSAVKGIVKQAVLSQTTPWELHIFVPVLATTAPLVTLHLDGYGAISQEITHRELLVSQPHHDSGKELATWVVDFEGLDSLIGDWIAFNRNLDYRYS